MGVAIRLATEIPIATGLGAIMGYGVDYFFGTKPWGIALGVVFGGAAGALNVYRVAQEMTKDIEKSDSRELDNKSEDDQN